MKFVFGFVAALIVMGVCGFGYFALGFAPVATASAPIPMETTLAKLALARVVSRDAPKAAAITASEENFAAGARLYRVHCAVCHGLPGQPQTAIAQGEFPKPPELFKGKGVTDDPPGETYWKVANGIRLTGMPAFNKSLTEEQMWQVSLMVANTDKLSPSVAASLREPLPQ